MAEQYYIYAITAPDIRLAESISGFGGPLHIVPHGELGAVVSRVRASDAGGFIPASTAENLMRHETVVEAVWAVGPALPVRFGTVLPDSEAVTRILAAQYETLRNDLRRIGDKIELGVTVLWRPAADIQSGEPTLRPDAERRSGTDTAAAGDRPGLAYLRTRQTEYRQAESVRKRAQTLARELDDVLRPHALECHRSLCPSERLALRDLYLMERGQIGEFERAFDEVRQRHQEVRFLLSGPWPPYSFVTPPARRDTEIQGRERADGSEWIGSNG